MSKILISTVTVTFVLLVLSFVQLHRWNQFRSGARVRNEEIYFVPLFIVVIVIAVLAIGSVVLVVIAALHANSSPYGWTYYPTAVLCSGLCLAASMEVRHTFIKIDVDELVIQSLASRRTVRVTEIEHVHLMRGEIVFRLRSGRAMIASKILGWNVSLRSKLRMLGPRRI